MQLIACLGSSAKLHRVTDWGERLFLGPSQISAELAGHHPRHGRLVHVTFSLSQKSQRVKL